MVLILLLLAMAQVISPWWLIVYVLIFWNP
jgi:hypothetical protein